MLCLKLIFLLLIVLFFKCCLLKTINDGGKDERFGSQYLRQMDATLNALDRAVKFYSSNIEKVNLDSVFGLRVGQGGLSKAITESKINSEEELFKRLVGMHAKIVELAERGFLELQSSNSEYFNKFEHLIDGKWFAIMPYHSVDLSLVHKITLHDDESFDEASSDKCMTNIIGSQQTGLQKQCQVTDKCWELMTKKGADGYYLTHQGLFLLLAENRGCREEILNKVGDDDQWQHQIKYIGANIYHQMLETFQQNKVDDDSIGKDLFFEQVIVCQMLGVLECFDVKYLDAILKLQDTSGCWKQGHKDEENDSRELVVSQEDQIQEEQHPVVRVQGRRLQEELVLQDGCSSHFTGVATGCLGMYAYWLVSHPDIIIHAGQSNKDFSDKSKNFKVWNEQHDMKIFLAIKWLTVFCIVALSFYFFRKWRRNLGPVLRKYRKLSI